MTSLERVFRLSRRVDLKDFKDELESKSTRTIDSAYFDKHLKDVRK